MPRLDGADISHYQATIDWPALRAATWWCATKATQGLNYVDPTFTTHWAQMSTQGFTHRLAYHWISATADPVAQAQHFLEVWPRDGGAMLDAEQAGITVAMCTVWCEAVEAVTGRPVSIYTGAYVAGGTIWQNTQLRWSKYGARPMHLAAYTTEAKALALPGVKAYPWSAWQFSSNGPVPGVAGRCDMNRIDNVAAYDLVCGLTANPHPPQEATMIVEGAPGSKYDGFIGSYALKRVTDLGEDWAELGSPRGVVVSDAWLDAKLALGLPAGPRGDQGPKGDKGDAGPQGLKGDKGDPGSGSGPKLVNLHGTLTSDGSITLTGTAV